MSRECVAMILAGGKGTRLHALTKKIAKPAVYFGGKYRIIDFSLSNVVNSGIDCWYNSESFVFTSRRYLIEIRPTKVYFLSFK